ncbi:minichromosome maintenance domain-containing protein 2 isoform X2 [Anabrus simplex]|uniref:minichromosome maintenance domain-containing protein 2 isoform X2 n=1 Tax=Anabrus simplex TaxID=316456 RepID=UPI0034DD8738
MFINPTAIDNSQPHTYGSHQAITVCFQDDLISGLHLGAQYNVAGHQSNKFFHAWSVQLWCPVGLGSSHLPLSTNIAKLHAWINEISVNSPWAFVTAICSYLAVDLYPTSAFFPLKYGLILSIANQASNIPIAILAVGEDTSVASHLMNRACYLAHRHQTFSCPAVSGPIGGVARWDEKGYRWFEAGPLILAAPGVCYLGDWSKFKQRNLQSTILSALESGQVSFDTQGSGPVGPTLSAPTFPLRCAVWTYWSWASHSRKQADQAHFHTLVNVFGIPFVVDDKNETENVASQILAQAMDGSDKKEPIITNSELREYLAMIANQPVTISKEASQLIRGYFVASRRVRPNCLPVGAVSTIAALSEAHARLARRDTVLYADVVAVLYLYETAILKLFGQCYVSPPPFNSSYQSELPLPIQMHNRLEEFSSWIDNYVRSLAGSNFSYFNNEE